MGLLFTGGHATFLGTPGVENAGGWRGVKAIEDLLPVDLRTPGPHPDGLFSAGTVKRKGSIDRRGFWQRVMRAWEAC